MNESLTADVLINFTLSVVIVVLWVMCGAILFLRRERIPRHYWLVWGAAATLGLLQATTITNVVLPDYWPTHTSTFFINGVLRGVSLTLLISFIVWTAGHHHGYEDG